MRDDGTEPQAPGRPKAFTGSTWAVLGVTVAVVLAAAVGAPVAAAVLAPKAATAPDVPEDEADTALVQVDLDYAFTVDGAPQTVEFTIRMVLSRAFYYDEAAEVAENVRPGEVATTVGPWRVSDFQSADRFIAESRTSLQGASLDALQCLAPIDVVVDLSDFARQNGDISKQCALDNATAEAVLGADADILGLAASLPPMTRAAPPAELMSLPGTEAPLSAFRIDTAQGPYLLFVAQLASPGSKDVQFLHRTAMVSLLPIEEPR